MHPSINLATIPQLSLEEALPRCRSAGFDAVGVWVDPAMELGLAETKKILDGEGLTVSSICPSGSFSDRGESGLSDAVRNTRRAIDVAAALESDCLCLLPGTLPPDSKDLGMVRALARRGLEEVLPYARDCKVKIAIEPLHPLYADNFSVLNTVSEALDWCEEFGTGLFFDTYHVWWDFGLEKELERAKGKVLGFHVNDWIQPENDLIQDRELPGKGKIDLPRLFQWVRATGYDGAAELEIFSTRYARHDADEWLKACRESLDEYI